VEHKSELQWVTEIVHDVDTYFFSCYSQQQGMEPDGNGRNCRISAVGKNLHSQIVGDVYRHKRGASRLGYSAIRGGGGAVSFWGGGVFGWLFRRGLALQSATSLAIKRTKWWSRCVARDLQHRFAPSTRRGLADEISVASDFPRRHRYRYRTAFVGLEV